MTNHEVSELLELVERIEAEALRWTGDMRKGLLEIAEKMRAQARSEIMTVRP